MFNSVLRFTTLALAFVTPFVSIDGVSAQFDGDRCGTIAPIGQERIDIEDSLRAFRSNITDARIAPATINVYFHVVAENNTREGGNVPDAMIQNQIASLNNDYLPAGLTFRLVQTDRTVNAAWYRRAYIGNAESTQMTSALSKGTGADLNIYTVGFKEPPPGEKPLLGYATFPWELAQNGKLDGVVLLAESLPGGTAAPFNLGKTATHEIGHWTGLFHTFQTGDDAFYCDTVVGDQVDDTPIENGPAFGCPVGRDTCPQAGLDPINNYMDYTDDSCMNNFTVGQANRLRAALSEYRGIPF
ncbi:hypothetical protein CVT24_009745 [Panaeolus cyanescens]|uniref:Peptidase M43 pregnancy-associated plasma-A domain-containing protein n=1 Tax=Panaeolus cyanescens TaxID=181874 RepID=A0A409Y9V8_9AGAR|nr:hypothetical protein CVT24_009745 [Panaeolus cyanescens]